MPTLTELLTSAVIAIGTGNLPPCEVVVAWDRSKHIILEHEMAHCWGWQHGEASYAGEFKPPVEVMALGEYPNLILRRVSTARAKRICGSYGCAKGGLMK